MYYYEALASQNPFYEKHFEKIIMKIKPILEEYAKNYLKTYKTDKLKRMNIGILNSYFDQFLIQLDGENNVIELFRIINGFIMWIHERLNLSLGEKLLGISEKDLKGLNYIDINKPLDEQKEIIYRKIEEEEKERV